MSKKSQTCFKVVKYLASPNYLSYMLELPTLMGSTSVDSVFLIWDNPDNGRFKGVEKNDMTVEEYKKWLTDLVKKIVDPMPQDLKNDILRDQRHLL